jgi:hypothetical protein
MMSAMGSGLLRTCLVMPLASALLGACATIIGISEYEIEPALAEGGDAGTAASTGEGGTGDAPIGGHAGAGDTAAAGAGGEGATAGADTISCDPAACDDEIECTVDACGASGECVHTPDTSLCDVDPGECVTCQAGIGCVASDLTQIPLLLDPHFDLLSVDWEEFISDNVNQQSIVALNAQAQSPDHAAVWVPVPDPVTAPEQGYADLLQDVVVPEGSQQLRLTGFYRLSAGVYAPDEDFVSAALFRRNGTTPELTFHEWYADEGSQSEWLMFDYIASAPELEGLLGESLTFDLYGYNWDSTFYFDTLSLTAGVCP